MRFINATIFASTLLHGALASEVVEDATCMGATCPLAKDAALLHTKSTVAKVSQHEGGDALEFERPPAEGKDSKSTVGMAARLAAGKDSKSTAGFDARLRRGKDTKGADAGYFYHAPPPGKTAIVKGPGGTPDMAGGLKKGWREKGGGGDGKRDLMKKAMQAFKDGDNELLAKLKETVKDKDRDWFEGTFKEKVATFKEQRAERKAGGGLEVLKKKIGKELAEKGFDLDGLSDKITEVLVGESGDADALKAQAKAALAEAVGNIVDKIKEAVAAGKTKDDLDLDPEEVKAKIRAAVAAKIGEDKVEQIEQLVKAEIDEETLANIKATLGAKMKELAGKRGQRDERRAGGGDALEFLRNNIQEQLAEDGLDLDDLSGKIVATLVDEGEDVDKFKAEAKLALGRAVGKLLEKVKKAKAAGKTADDFDPEEVKANIRKSIAAKIGEDKLVEIEALVKAEIGEERIEKIKAGLGAKLKALLSDGGGKDALLAAASAKLKETIKSKLVEHLAEQGKDIAEFEASLKERMVESGTTPGDLKTKGEQGLREAIPKIVSIIRAKKQAGGPVAETILPIRDELKARVRGRIGADRFDILEKKMKEKLGEKEFDRFEVGMAAQIGGAIDGLDQDGLLPSGGPGGPGGFGGKAGGPGGKAGGPGGFGGKAGGKDDLRKKLGAEGDSGDSTWRGDR